MLPGGTSAKNIIYGIDFVILSTLLVRIVKCLLIGR